jgi:hypothetical protein
MIEFVRARSLIENDATLYRAEPTQSTEELFQRAIRRAVTGPGTVYFSRKKERQDGVMLDVWYGNFHPRSNADA